MKLVILAGLVWLLGAATHACPAGREPTDRASEGGADDGEPDTEWRARQSPQGIEIEVHAQRAFPVASAMPVLFVGARELRSSRYPTGDLHVLAFAVSDAEWSALTEGAPMTVRYDPPGERGTWSLGVFDRARLR